MNYEWVGLLGSVTIIIAFLFKDEKKIRIADGIGAFLFIIYGILIHSFSNIFLNSVLIGVQIWRLIGLGKRTKSNSAGS